MDFTRPVAALPRSPEPARAAVAEDVRCARLALPLSYHSEVVHSRRLRICSQPAVLECGIVFCIVHFMQSWAYPCTLCGMTATAFTAGFNISVSHGTYPEWGRGGYFLPKQWLSSLCCGTKMGFAISGFFISTWEQTQGSILEEPFNFLVSRFPCLQNGGSDMGKRIGDRGSKALILLWDVMLFWASLLAVFNWLKCRGKRSLLKSNVFHSRYHFPGEDLSFYHFSICLNKSHVPHFTRKCQIPAGWQPRYTCCNSPVPISVSGNVTFATAGAWFYPYTCKKYWEKTLITWYECSCSEWAGLHLEGLLWRQHFGNSSVQNHCV